MESSNVIARCRELALISESASGTLRTFLSPAMRHCYEKVGSWMKDAGMQVRVDAAGNLRGRYPGKATSQRTLMMGSHLDTVKDAGAFDGILGVVIAITLVEDLAGRRLPFDIEVIGFSEEEGVRFGFPFIGSMALIGALDESILQRTDGNGVTVKQAIQDFGLDPAHIADAAPKQRPFAFVEFHIEQGPVLDCSNEPVAIVNAIAGQSRSTAVFTGRANHAGTTPMPLRRDALSGAAEWIGAIEREALSTDGLVATAGKIEVVPGATNVIAGEARVSLDVRHALDAVRVEAHAKLRHEAAAICQRRHLELHWTDLVNQSAVALNVGLANALDLAGRRAGVTPRRMISGAGHDAMILASKMPSSMLFLRSPGGISHHPDETVRAEDVEIALRIGRNLIDYLGTSYRELETQP